MTKYQWGGERRREGEHNRGMVFDLLGEIKRGPERRGNSVLIRMQND